MPILKKCIAFFLLITTLQQVAFSQSHLVSIREIINEAGIPAISLASTLFEVFRRALRTKNKSQSMTGIQRTKVAIKQ